MSATEYDIRPGLDFAIIGMSGKFPGANNIREFWKNLKNGIETICFYSVQELKEAGCEPGILENPTFVRAKGMLEGIEYFDTSFFGYTPGEAEKLDPQIRVFHEYVWNALEDAGYVPDTYEGAIGLYAGASNNPTWELAILTAEPDIFAAVQYTDKDQMTTRISHKLNLTGPSFSIETQCSTSLVAVHLACQGLLSGECDMAAAGGISILFLLRGGHFYQEGMPFSPDGHCRPFDKEANGTVFGDGVGVVVLKRIEDAIDDGDHIYALIKGTAINNDGNNKIGYSAPGADGQAEVMQTAIRTAQVEPESITYIETHGTGTNLGDPIEIQALKMAFNTDKKGYCRIGSVKSNMGHLNNAAGITSLIKTVLAIKNKMIPPSIHFKTPNPKIDFENSPFLVNTRLTEWKNQTYPLRAGVSSFGIGGTNAHVIIEEWPGNNNQADVGGMQRIDRTGSSGSKEYQLILLSAKTETALDQMTRNLADHFKKNSHLNLANAAYTLQVGRKTFPHRRMLVCPGLNEAAGALFSKDPGGVQTFFTMDEDRPMVFMFPGQGAQYVNMGLELYQTEPVFKKEMDSCFEILESLLKYDIKEILYPGETGNKVSDGLLTGEISERINRTEITQPVLFIFEYSLSKLLVKWGITPDAMIGHSSGEYTAACLSGVFSLEDAIKLVTLRGKLMQQQPGGSMQSVSIARDQLIPLLELNNDISLAAVNSPGHCVISGPHEAIEMFALQLGEKGFKSKLLHTSHAFHSKMMDPILEEFADNLRSTRFNKPEIPYISNLTGKFISPEEAASPGYWVKQLRETVRFSQGVKELLKGKNYIFLEVGPGRTLRTFVKQHLKSENSQLPVNLIRHPRENVSDIYYLMGKIGHLWLAGKKIDWQEFNLHHHNSRQRIPLPAYSFDRIPFWPAADPYTISAGMSSPGETNRPVEKKDKTEWFYIPSWEHSILTHIDRKAVLYTRSCWLVFIDKSGFGTRLLKRLEQESKQVIPVHMGPTFAEEDHGHDSLSFTLDPRQADHYEKLFNRLSKLEKTPAVIIHLWGITPDSRDDSLYKELNGSTVENFLDSGFCSLVNTVQAIGKENITDEMFIAVVTNNMHDVTGEEILCPEKAAVLAPVKTIPLEYPNITCRSIDIILPGSQCPREVKIMDYLVQEIRSDSKEPVVAYRGKHRWTRSFKNVRLDNPNDEEMVPALKQGSVWMILGGGNTALAAAGYLENNVNAKLIVILPPELSTGEKGNKWEDIGTPGMIFYADISDASMMKKTIDRVKKQFFRIDGLIYAYDDVDQPVSFHEIPADGAADTVAAKMKELVVLDRVLKNVDLKPEFFIIFSSVGSIIYQSQAGKIISGALYHFLDAFACYKTYKDSPDTFTVTIDNWITPAEVEVEWRDIFNRLLDIKLPRIAVSPLDLNYLIRHYDEYEKARQRRVRLNENRLLPKPAVVPKTTLIQRQGLSSEYKSPETETQGFLKEIWQKFLGIENIGIYDDFFELGGDSLNAMNLIAIIHKEQDVKISLDFFFSNPTIKKLAQYIEKHGQEDMYSQIEPVEKKEYYPLSPVQRRLLFINKSDPGSLGYNMATAHTVEGEIDLEELTGVYRTLIRRHESFRTSFHLIAGKSLQKIHDTFDFNIESFDLQPDLQQQQNSYNDPRGSQQQNSSLNRVIKNFVRPFDLAKAPLLRVGLIRIKENKNLRHIIILDMHHIVSDGTSSGIISEELVAITRGVKLPLLRIQYKDYARWYNKILASEWIRQQEAYWLKQFETEVPVLNLPIDFERPPKRSFEGGLFPFEIKKERIDRLHALARDENATLFMVVLAIYSILLSKLSGLEDIVVVSIVTGRHHTDLDRVIGMFVNSLFYRNYPKRDMSFISFLKEVRTRALEVFENQNYQMDDLVEKINTRREPGRHPITDVAFRYQNIFASGTDSSDPAKVNPFYQVEEDFTKGDFTLHAIEKNKELSFSIEYCKKLFKKETIERYTGYLKEIIVMVLENRDIKLKDIHLTSNLIEAKSKNTEIEFEL